jgi:site-specific recombinase XerD
MQEMLGHTNLSQTSTYLHASEFGLQESIRRFDALRGNPWQRLPR